MKKLATIAVGCLVLLFFAAVALLCMTGMTQTGAADQVNYRFSSSAFRNTSFTSSPGSFSFASSTWFGTSPLDVTMKMGRLMINGQDAGPLVPGDTIEVTADQRVAVNGVTLH